MNKINFKNLPDTSTPLSAENLNQLQDNVEDAIDNVSIDLDTQVSTTSTNGVENQAITNYVNSAIPEVKTTQTTSDTATYSCNYIDSLKVVSIYSNSKSVSGIDDKVSITFTAPFDGIIEINGSWSGWAYAGGDISISITNTIGSATLLGAYSQNTNGHDTNAVPMAAKAYYTLVKNTQYVFSAQLTGRSGSGDDIYIIGVLRQESV